MCISCVLSSRYTLHSFFFSQSQKNIEIGLDLLRSYYALVYVLRNYFSVAYLKIHQTIITRYIYSLSRREESWKKNCLLACLCVRRVKKTFLIENIKISIFVLSVGTVMTRRKGGRVLPPHPRSKEHTPGVKKSIFLPRMSKKVFSEGLRKYKYYFYFGRLFSFSRRRVLQT